MCLCVSVRWGGCRSVTWPTIGCRVILKVFFLGAYNDLFKVFLLLLTGPPEVLGFVRRTAARLCLSSTAF